ncbi:hypothetical protein B1813_09405 [Saccharomonospora piscinae]|uniref:Uncharacterized protein n=1 Tax=Saccharomonospora piscinae TaxID=687388 RepID=A0A1V9A5T8_SACPI|nr:hypothetical protein [Saccharomonospora piscinae]OQO92408.1 hypothetical protein B1813_09405 [Saccharomonospora piscinae]TLW91876.1 hypothetical protein FFT09_13250 [Saccharomonospora piscinae]
MNRFVRQASFASTVALLITLLVGAVHTASASPSETERPPESAPTSSSDDVVQALVVGGTAFALMVGAGTAVLFYTARQRRDEPL